MKVAVCFFGQPRFLNNPYSYLSHKYWIFDKYDIDIYIHTWISKDDFKIKYSDWVYKQQIIRNDKYEEPIINKNIENDIIKKYKPYKYKFEEPINFELSELEWIFLKDKESKYLNEWEGEFYLSKNNENNILSHLYSKSETIKLIDKNINYDWVILTRFDNYIMDFPNLNLLDNNFLYLDNENIYNFSDVILFGGLNYVEPFNLYDNISNLIDDINFFTPEEFKRVSFFNKFNKEKEKRIKMKVSIIRSENGEKKQE